MSKNDTILEHLKGGVSSISFDYLHPTLDFLSKETSSFSISCSN
jgi:hypothetical protein